MATVNVGYAKELARGMYEVYRKKNGKFCVSSGLCVIEPIKSILEKDCVAGNKVLSQYGLNTYEFFMALEFADALTSGNSNNTFGREVAGLISQYGLDMEYLTSETKEKLESTINNAIDVIGGGTAGEEYTINLFKVGSLASGVVREIKKSNAEIEEAIRNAEKALDKAEVEAMKKAEEEAKERAEAAEEEDKKLKEGNVSGKANDISAEEQAANDERLMALVKNLIDTIMNVYAQVYQPLFFAPPRGVLYRDEYGNGNIMAIGRSGDPTDKENVRVHGIPSLEYFCNYIYDAIITACPYIKEAPKTGDHGMYIRAAWMHPNGTMDYNYAPHIQIRNCMGVYLDKDTNTLKRAKTWTEFRSKLQQELKGTIISLLRRANLRDPKVVKTAIESIKELYTTIFLVNEFDAEKVMRFTVYSASGSSGSNKGCTGNIAKAIVSANPLSKPLSSYKIMDDSEELDVRRIMIVTDVNKYRGEINFAYKTLGKVLATGGKIDLGHTVVGTSLSGSAVELNLKDNTYVSIGVVAGSGSGKGVLTMSLVAAMLAAKCPVIYLDYKPDMACIFWNMDRRMGTRTLAVDGLTGMSKCAVPVRNYTRGFGIKPELFDAFNSYLALLPYVKGVQLMNLIAKARTAGKIPMKTKMFFVLDEAQACSEAIEEAKKKIESAVSDFKPKGKDAPTDLFKSYMKLLAVYKTVGNSANEFLNTNGRTGNMGALVLGQQADATNWRGPFNNMMLRCSAKFLGTGTVNTTKSGGSKYGLPHDITGVEMVGRGYFGLCTGNAPTASNTQIIKTTMVLNEADFDVESRTGGQFSGPFLNNISDEEILNDIIENDMIVSENNEVALTAGLQVGQANTLVGFDGLIKFMGAAQSDFNLMDVLNAGYDIAEKVLNMLGLVGEGCPYDTVEGYLCSGRDDSLFTNGQLMNALVKGVTVFDYIENPGNNGSDDGRIPDSGEQKKEDDELIGFGAGAEAKAEAPKFDTTAAPVNESTAPASSEVAGFSVVDEPKFDSEHAPVRPATPVNTSANEGFDFGNSQEIQATEDDLAGALENLQRRISEQAIKNPSADLTQVQKQLSAISESLQPLFTKSNSHAFGEGANNEPTIDTTKSNNTRDVDETNTIDSCMDSEAVRRLANKAAGKSMKAWWKFLDARWALILDTIRRQEGASNVRDVKLNANQMFVNGKNVIDPAITDASIISDRAVADMCNWDMLFSIFKKINVVEVDEVLLATIDTQFAEQITEKDVERGVTDSVSLMLLRYPELNTVVAAGVKRPKVELVRTERSTETGRGKARAEMLKREADARRREKIEADNMEVAKRRGLKVNRSIGKSSSKSGTESRFKQKSGIAKFFSNLGSAITMRGSAFGGGKRKY